MKVVITVALTDDDGITHSAEIAEHSWMPGDRDDRPPARVAERAIQRARKALAKLVPAAK
jgi:hypothetical protein